MTESESAKGLCANDGSETNTFASYRGELTMPLEPVDIKEVIVTKESALQTSEQIQAILEKLKELPDGGFRMLDLAQALSHRGHQIAAAQVEIAALELGNPEVTHRWRKFQAARAPANQFLLLNDTIRNAAFSEALASQIRPGDAVFEIGTGSSILAILAAKAGAEQVTTCERQPLMAAIAKLIVDDNNLSEVISVVPKPLAQIDLQRDLGRRADVLVSDLFSGSLLEAGGLELMHQAREKLGSESIRAIPTSASLRGVLVGGPELEGLCRIESSPQGDFSRFNLFSPPILRITPERFRVLRYSKHSRPFDCFTFDFTQPAAPHPRRREIDVKCTLDGRILGLLQWVRLELSPNIHLESHENAKLMWPRFLHTFPEPIKLGRDQKITLHLEHDLTSFSVWPIG